MYIIELSHQQSRMKIMMDNIKYIFPYIAIYFQEAEQGKAMKFLQVHVINKSIYMLVLYSMNYYYNACLRFYYLTFVLS